MAELAASDKLKKELGLFGVFCLATGATLSSGFFLLPGLAALQAGPGLIFAYLLAVVPLLPGILSKIELATAMPRAGGEYYFIDRSLGPLAGTICGLGTWLSLVLKTAFALIGIGAYLGVFFPDFGESNYVWIACGIAVLLGGLNLFGAQKSSGIQMVLVIVLLGLLSWFVAAGIPRINGTHFTAGAWMHLNADVESPDGNGFLINGWGNLFAATGLVCVSYMGLTKVASVAEEVKDPERNLTLGIILAMVAAVVIYGVGTFILVGVLPPEQLATGAVGAIDGKPHVNLRPVADAAEVMIGRAGAVIMTIAAICAFLSVANAGILSASRYPLAMSRDRLLPEPLSKLNKHKVPQLGVFVTVLAVVMLLVLFDPMKIAKLASTFLLLLFAFNCMAVIVMRESKIDSYDPGFYAPFYPWMQLFGIITSGAVIVVMGWLPMAFALGLVVVGGAWYFYYAASRVDRGGAIYHLFARLGAYRFEGLDVELRGILKEKGLRVDDPFDEVTGRAGVIDERGAVNFEDLVHRASVLLAANLPIKAEELANMFLEGTRVGATPVAKGVALPHTRFPGIDKPLMALCRVHEGVHIDINVDHNHIESSQGEAIYAVIFLVSPEGDASQHLRMLAQLASFMDNDKFKANWLGAMDDAHLREVLLRDERYMSIDVSRDGPAKGYIGREIRNLTLPEGCLITAIRRHQETLIPRGRTSLRVGDRLTVIGVPEAIAALRADLEI